MSKYVCLTSDVFELALGFKIDYGDARLWFNPEAHANIERGVAFSVELAKQCFVHVMTSSGDVTFLCDEDIESAICVPQSGHGVLIQLYDPRDTGGLAVYFKVHIIEAGTLLQIDAGVILPESDTVTDNSPLPFYVTPDAPAS